MSMHNAPAARHAGLAHLAEEDEPQGRTGKAPAARRRWILAVTVLCILALGLGYVLLSGQRTPSTMLGASAQVQGGLARINGVIPLENDNWQPPASEPVLAGTPREGSHRVRILLEVITLDAGGVDFSASDYSIDGLGGAAPVPIWASPQEHHAVQGESFEATLVFELPNQDVPLVLEAEDGARLDLGTGHHTD